MTTQYSNPWMDIASYGIEQSEKFKGRSADTNKFLDIINNGCMSVLYADSGIGKTSFINAGINAVLIRQGFLPVHIVFPDNVYNVGTDISQWFYDLLTKDLCYVKEPESKESIPVREWRFLFAADEKKALKAGIKDAFSPCKNNLWWLLHAYQLTDIKTGKPLKPLMIFDQFEEVFVKTNEDFDPSKEGTAKTCEKKLLEQIFCLIDGISPNAFPSEVRNMLKALALKDIFLDLNTQNSYKVIFALRKEYLSDFDYWTNEKHCITDLLRNRMLLRPMTREQAKEVITQQPLIDTGGNIIKGWETETLNAIEADITSFIDDKNRNEVEPFLLSVLCKRLFDRAIEQGKERLSKDDLAGYDIKTIIRNFYESLVQQSLDNNTLHSENEIIQLENILVANEDGHRKRPSLKDDKELKAFLRGRSDVLDRLESLHLIRRTSFGESNFLEIIHDQFAKVIHERQKERKREKEEKKNSQKVILLRSVLIITALLTLWCTIYFGVNVRKNEPSVNDLTRINSLVLTTNDVDWLEQNNKYEKDCTTLRDNSLVESFTITGDNNKVAIIDCYMLKTIDIEGLRKDELSLTVEGCPQLTEIVVKDHVKKLDYHINGCPKVQIHLNNTVETFKLDTKEKYLTFKINENDTNLLWKDHILWDMRKNEEAILYAQDGVPASLPFPPAYKKHSLTAANLQRSIENSRLASSQGGDSVLLLNKPDITAKLIANRNVKEVFLGDSVTTIYAQAFKGCKQLRRVHFPTHKITILLEAFAGCSSLDSVIFRGDTVYLGERAFAGCKSLETIQLPLCVNVNTVAFDLFSVTLGVRHEQSYVMLPYDYSPFMECAPDLSPQIKEEGNLVEEDGIIFLKDGHIPIFVKSNAKPYNNDNFFTEDGSLFVARKHTNTLCWLSKSKEERSEMAINQLGNISDASGGLFINDVILPSLGSTALRIPAKSRCKYFFPLGAGQIQAIHVPYPQPEGIHDTGASKEPTVLDFDLPDSVKEHITLYVPSGSKRFYENCVRFNAFKAIREEGDRLDVYRRFAFKLNDAVVNDFDNYKYLYVLYPLIAILIGWFIFRLRRKQLSKTLESRAAKRMACWFALAYVIISAVLYHVLVPCFMVFTTMSSYFPIYAGNFHHIPIAFLTLGGAALFMYAPELTRYLSECWQACIKLLKGKAVLLHRLYRKAMTYKMKIYTVMLILLAVVIACNMLLDAINPKEAMRRGDYDKALELFANSFLSFKRLSVDEQQMLRTLLIREHCLPGVPDSTIWEDVNGYTMGGGSHNPYFGVSTPDGYLLYDLKNKTSFNIPRRQGWFSTSPTGRFAVCKDDSVYIYGMNGQWTIPIGEKYTAYWYDQDRYLFIQSDSICNIYDTENMKRVFSCDFNYTKDTPNVGHVSRAPLYIEPYSTIVIEGRKKNTTDRHGAVCLLNLKSMKHMELDFWPKGIVKNRFLIKSERQNTQLFDLAECRMLTHDIPGYADDGNYDNILCKYPCAVYFLADDGSNMSCLDLSKEYRYVHRVNNQYVLLQNRVDPGIELFDIIHSKHYKLPVRSKERLSYMNMNIQNSGRDLYLYDQDTQQAFIYHLYNDRIELRYNASLSSGNISYGSNVMFVGNMCYYFYEDDSFLVAKDDELSVSLRDGNYIVEKREDQQWSIYPIGTPKEEAIPIEDNYSSIICGWVIKHSGNQTQIINIMTLRQLIEKSTKLTDEQKHVLFKRLGK